MTRIKQTIPWGERGAIIQPHYYKGEHSNKPYELELMLHLRILQNLCDLSGEATLTAVIDSRTFPEFCGVESSDQAPDGDTIGRFRNVLIKNGLQEKLFQRVIDLLGERGLILKKGAIVDPTLISAPSSTKDREKKRDRTPIRSKKSETRRVSKSPTATISVKFKIWARCLQIKDLSGTLGVLIESYPPFLPYCAVWPYI